MFANRGSGETSMRDDAPDAVKVRDRSKAADHDEPHLQDPELTAERIARANHIAPRTLNRLFAADGTTPIRWLWQQRLSAGFTALAEGQVSQVTDAAMNFGFNDLSHFSRAFKKTFGCSPQSLKQPNRAQNYSAAGLPCSVPALRPARKRLA